MGNRGCLHDPDRRLGAARWRSKLWICCTLTWKNVRRDPMPPGRWTALFSIVGFGGMVFKPWSERTKTAQQLLMEAQAPLSQVAGIRGRRHFEDSLGICIFTGRTRMENLCRALSAATGWTYTLADALRLGRRTAAILRAFNLRCGIGTDLEYPSARYGSQPVDGPAKDHNIMDQWERMREVWYATVGYDIKTGKPTRETLHKLGLDWLARDLWRK